MKESADTDSLKELMNNCGHGKKERSGKCHHRKCTEFTLRDAKKSGCHSRQQISYVILVLLVILSIVFIGLYSSCIGQHVNVPQAMKNCDCPQAWIGLGNKCFHFSENISSWTSSKNFCASHEAALAYIETELELNFMKRYISHFDHWIGLSRESSTSTWKWTNNTKYDSRFAIKGDGKCAFLNDKGLSSGKNSVERRWICTKSKSDHK